MDGINSHSCMCYPGFTGENCSINIDDCSPSVCQNNGTCEDRVDDFICSCPDTYAGKTCERQSSCSPEQDNCRNNGFCNMSSTEGIIETSCECLSGYTGLTCETEINECLSDPCESNGNCIDLIGRFQCLCPAGLTGDQCQTDEDLCAIAPCQNGGICMEIAGGTSTMCFCRTGFTDGFCQTNINECLGIECLNGGTCVDEIATYSCNCTDDFMGERCEIPILSMFFFTLCKWRNMYLSEQYFVHALLYTCPTGFTGPNCTIQLTSDPNYTVRLTQDPSDPRRNLTMLIQDQATLNPVAVAVSSSVMVFVLSSVIFFIFGYICGCKYNQCHNRRTGQADGGHDTEETQPVQLVRSQDIELSENVVYEPVYEDVLPRSEHFPSSNYNLANVA